VNNQQERNSINQESFKGESYIISNAVPEKVDKQ
jgi:hypothetical protein